MPKRELSEEEKKAVNDAIRRNMDNMFQWTQFKMSLRLWRDEEGINKDALKYVDESLTMTFNEILKDIVPKVQKRTKTFIEMVDSDFDKSVLTDPLLHEFRTVDYIYHIELSDVEEKEHPIADLSYVPQSGNRFMLQGGVGGQEWAIVDSNPVTEQQVQDKEIPEKMVTVPHGVYRIWCFQCREFFTLEMNAGDAVGRIVCDKCKTTVIEKRQHNA